MITDSVTLGTFVDRVLTGMQSPNELGRRTALATAITTAAQTTFTVTDATLFQVTAILEFGSELMYVTTKSSDLAGATITVVRGYAGTTASTYLNGTVGAINPPWPRQVVADQIVAAFPYMEGNRLPLIVTSSELTPERDTHDDNRWLIDIPATARHVYLVRVGLKDVNGWTYIDGLPTSGTYSYSTGKVVTLPAYSRSYYPEMTPENLVFTVVYRAAYTWSADPPVEASTITIGEGALEVPVKYAIWQLTEARERGRQQVDRSTELREGLGFDTGPQHVRLARETFFSSLDVARRLEPPPRTRPFVSYPTFSEVY
jgi:hypothetical protein